MLKTTGAEVCRESNKECSQPGYHGNKIQNILDWFVQIKNI